MYENIAETTLLVIAALHLFLMFPLLLSSNGTRPFIVGYLGISAVVTLRAADLLFLGAHAAGIEVTAAIIALLFLTTLWALFSSSSDH